jgi:putative tryptophan/tyrosine transport system substrate-binding protein
VRRRAFLLGGLAVGVAGAVRAEPRRARVAIAMSEHAPAYVAAFTSELMRLGWQEGETVETKVGDGAGDPAALPGVIASLVAWAPNVIVSSSNRTHFVVRDATSTIPVVAVAAIDPIRLGLSDSLARPSKNFTGTIGFIEGLMGKRMELLREVLPQARRVALHLDPANPAFVPTHRDAVLAATPVGLEIVVAGYGNRAEVVGALDQAKAQGADAVMVLPDGIALSQMDAVAARAAELRLPTLAFNDNELRLGMTFVLGPDRALMWREAAVSADRILRGARTSDLPFQQPSKVYVGINLRSARSLGVQVPLPVLARADEVIE